MKFKMTIQNKIGTCASCGKQAEVDCFGVCFECGHGEAIDEIRRQNPQSFLPSGAQMAQILKKGKAE